MKAKLTKKEKDTAAQIVCDHYNETFAIYEKYQKQLDVVTRGQWKLRHPEQFD